MHKHPDTELLDRLRAGLLDEFPDEKREIEMHLSACNSCRDRHESWKQIGPAAIGPVLDNETLQEDLARARHKALGTGKTRVSAALLPFAAAALLVLGVSVTLLNLDQGVDNGLSTVAQQEQLVPDLYEDVEFYLWMADHEDDPSPEDTQGSS